ncbi:hypothetical protein C8J57DRAFT_571777 [Mycena rebaudengoi]|nr:hypothetical protein C8J57DRAFT_571777 [Mycena rebaudengoi]
MAEAENDKLKGKLALVESVGIDDLTLNFTIPGYDTELRPRGRDVAVTKDNVEEYIHEVLEAIIGEGAQVQAKAFREGFPSLPTSSSLETLRRIALSEAVKADHGFNGESRAIRDLVEILSEYDPMTRNYLQFVTGVRGKLPLILRS